MKSFQSAKWIWIPSIEDLTRPSSAVDTYGEFFIPFSYQPNGDRAIYRVSCDGDYTLFVNGKPTGCNQYGDFEHYKIYDEIDVTDCLHAGENTLALLVWHYGVGTSRYKPAAPGVIFEVTAGERVLCESSQNVLCRRSKTYKNEGQKLITAQLGFSFSYDATQEDGWEEKGGELVPALPVSKRCSLYPRPTAWLEIEGRAPIDVLKAEGNYYLIDLGKETVGLPVLQFFSATEQQLRVEFGEHLIDGHVRRIIGNRDFSFAYKCKQGQNEYVNYMLRLGCRYLEIYAERPIELQYAGLLPQVYPTVRKSFTLQNPLDQRIYDLCVTTLELCMMEHYVDCPWREQCLYVLDARNQMLCGYDAFVGGNVSYVRANLKLISEDRREDDLLSICYPCGVDLTIPSFSLHYFKAVEEYLARTDDVAFAEEIFEKLQSVLGAFLRRRKDGLVMRFREKQHWNFYDWSPYLDGGSAYVWGKEAVETDAMLNLLFIIALQHFKGICERIGREFAYGEALEETKRCTRKAFFNEKAGVFTFTEGGEEYTATVNAFAILAGLSQGEEAKGICERLVGGALTECSLSLKAFKYDALLAVDRERYAEAVLQEIRKDYQTMLSAGATSAWETIDGAAAFGNAGSLCHGWSAIPVHYYHLLCKS